MPEIEDTQRAEAEAAADDSMWFMDGPDLVTWVYRLDEPDEITNARKLNLGHAYIAQIFGAIDPERVKAAVGGGVFKLKICKGREIVRNRTVAIEAPRKSFDAPAAPAAAPAQPSSIDPAALAETITKGIVAGLSPLLAQRHDAPAAPPLTLETMMQIIDKVRPSAPPARDPLEDFDRYKSLFDSVQRSSSSGRSIGDAIVESMPHLVEMADKVVTARINGAALAGARASRPIVPARVQVQAAPASSSPAGEAAPPQQHAAEPTEGPGGGAALTMVSIADQVARALRNRTTPEDFADMLELQFTEGELSFLRTLTPATITEMLRPYAGHYPELGTDVVEPYVTEVLSQLAIEPNGNGSGASVIDDAPDGGPPSS